MTTKEQIIAMARKAGFTTGTRDYADGEGGIPYVTPVATGSCLNELERLATLVRDNYRAELLAGVGEPVAEVSDLGLAKYNKLRHGNGPWNGPLEDDSPLYTADQLAAAVLAARNAALEEAAFRFEDLHLYGTKTADTKGCAAIIRNMKEPNA